MVHPWGYDHDRASPYPHLRYRLWGYWRPAYPHIRPAFILPRWTSADEYPVLNDEFDLRKDGRLRTSLNCNKPPKTATLVAPQGFEPRYAAPEAAVLPALFVPAPSPAFLCFPLFSIS
jgi:hypothetical protein